MEFRILGPLEVWSGDSLVEVTAPQQRAVLALLLTRPRRVVPAQLLIESLWEQSPPPTARASLQTYVYRVRRILERYGRGSCAIRTQGPGYLLDVAPPAVDSLRFDQLAAEGLTVLRGGDSASGVAKLREALALWRGAAFADIPLSNAQAEASRLNDKRLAVLEACLRAEVDLGRHLEVIGEVERLAHAHPLREGAWGTLMRALQRAGRPGDAITTYATARRHLVAELGIEPGSELQQIHQSILTGVVSDAEPPSTPAPPIEVTPAQLPADVPTFVGRVRHLRLLDRLLPSDGDRMPTAAVLSTIEGTAGVGKTALAVNWAYRVADRFPDGQLYVNLRGFDPASSPLDPAHALQAFLEALGVAAQRIPLSLAARVGLYRSLLAGRRVLVVLDNALDAAQVRPLLPGSAGSVVVVTSRSRLSGLIAAEGAYPLILDLLSPDEARHMLVSRLGADRVAAEPHAMREIVVRSARLPLALAIFSARAATHPAFPLAALAKELRESVGRLNAFTDGDTATDVRESFSYSYRVLSSDAARLFRQLSLHPGPDFAGPAAASLAGVSAREVRSMLAELTRGYLVTEHTPGRYKFHDLLRAYATDLAYSVDPPDERRAAVHRMLTHYLYGVDSASRLLNLHRRPVVSAAMPAGIALEDLDVAWFTTEWPVLMAVMRQAARDGFTAYAAQLARTLVRFLNRRDRWHDHVVKQEAALRTARRVASRVDQARAHRALGRAYSRLGRKDDAHAQLKRALDLYGELADDIGQADTHVDLAFLAEEQDRYDEVLRHGQWAFDRYQAAGQPTGEANALNALGWCYSRLGDHYRAIAHCRQALDRYGQLDDRRGQVVTWDGLGWIYHHHGQHQQAVTCYQRALELYRDLGDEVDGADALTRVTAGRLAADGTGDVWRRSLLQFVEVGQLDGGSLRAESCDQALGQSPEDDW